MSFSASIRSIPGPSGVGRILLAARRRPVAVSLAIAGCLGAAYLVFTPATADLAAQTFRAGLFEREGFVIWNAAWYNGHYVPGYSLLFPPPAALLGARLVGALATLAAAGLFAAIAHREFGERAWIGSLWFAVASATMLVSGRLTFALGVAIGLGALLALQRSRIAAAVALAALSALASPVAGLFTALAGAAVALAAVRRTGTGWKLDGSWRGGAGVALGAAAALAALALAFPTEGVEPFVLSAFVGVPLLLAGGLILLSPEQRLLRVGLVLYALLALAALLAPTPLGGNVTRLGALFAGPVLALALVGRRPLILALCAVPLLYWQWVAPVRDVAKASGDPSSEAAYHAPLLAELDRRGGGTARIHVPPTRNRWEAAHVGERFALTRGWLRQLESDDFDRFGRGGLTRTNYERWLHERDVSYVALSDADPDYLAKDEGEMIRGGLPFLRPVWSDEHWALYAVEPADAGRDPVTLTDLGADRFEITAERPGSYLVGLRYSPYFKVVGGEGCVGRDGQWTRVEVGEPASSARAASSIAAEAPAAMVPEPLQVEARLSLGGLLRHDRSCSE
jgi:hypothetical protein